MGLILHIHTSTDNIREGQMNNCQLRDKNFQGYCEGCNERVYCMLSELMQKISELEAKLNHLNQTEKITTG
ncbi:MAG: hypothetical protein NUV31_02110 [Dehalococcoidales bacterium]|jgi:hypothetical protein|nr:hypothetical protein [Dehalococcoidales bacterium]